MRERILLARKHHGIGDWILMMSLIRQINRQYPELEVHIDMNGTPLWFAQLPIYMDVVAVMTCNTKAVNYKCIWDHVVYRNFTTHSDHLLLSIMREFNSRTGLKLDTSMFTGKDPISTEHLASYRGPYPYSARALPQPYVLMPSVGAGGGRRNPEKEWGAENFQALADILRERGVNVVQIGREGDPVLNTNLYRFECTLPEMHSLVIHSAAVVSLENALSHWSGHHAKRTYTLYFTGRHPIRPCHTQYPNQVPITVEAPSPEYVSELILNNGGATTNGTN